MISMGWNCFAVNCQKNLIQLYDRVTTFFLFVTVNVISPLPRCSSRLAPFCFMKNSNMHACIVSALSIELTTKRILKKEEENEEKLVTYK